MNKTKIEWCDFTWNPVVGCTGSCPYCYARKMSARFHRDFDPHWVQKNFDRSMPKKPSRIFVNSMSDVADWDQNWTNWVHDRIVEEPQHLFLFLSKRPWEWSLWNPVNSMIGFSATCDDDLWSCADHARGRIGGLMGNVSFLSIEPILGPIHLNAEWLPRWIIIGAETGNRKGKVAPDPGWIKSIYEYATNNSIPLFFKESLRSLWPFDGYDYFPQEYPSCG